MEKNQLKVYINFLKPHIQKALKEGFSEEIVEQTLVEKGWPSEVIKEAIKELNYKKGSIIFTILFVLSVISAAYFAFKMNWLFLGASLVVAFILLIINRPRKVRTIKIPQKEKEMHEEINIIPLAPKRESFLSSLFKRKPKKEKPKIIERPKPTFVSKVAPITPIKTPVTQTKSKKESLLKSIFKSKPKATKPVQIIKPKEEIKEEKPKTSIIYLIFILIGLATTIYSLIFSEWVMWIISLYVIYFSLLIQKISSRTKIKAKLRIKKVDIAKKILKEKVETLSEIESEEVEEPSKKGKYQTTFDLVYKTIYEAGKISMDELAKKLNVEQKKLEEWVRVLEDNKLIKVSYRPIGSPILEKWQSPEKKRKK